MSKKGDERGYGDVGVDGDGDDDEKNANWRPIRGFRELAVETATWPVLQLLAELKPKMLDLNATDCLCAAAVLLCCCAAVLLCCVPFSANSYRFRRSLCGAQKHVKPRQRRANRHSHEMMIFVQIAIPRCLCANSRLVQSEQMRKVAACTLFGRSVSSQDFTFAALCDVNHGLGLLSRASLLLSIIRRAVCALNIKSM